MFSQTDKQPTAQPFNAASSVSSEDTPQRRYQPEEYGPWTPKDVREAGIVHPACTMPMF